MLGLTPEGYAVMWCPGIGNPAQVAWLSGGLLFFKTFNEAKAAAPAFIAQYFSENNANPPYVWVQALDRFWMDGVQQ